MLDEVIIFKTQNSKLPKISGIYGIRNLVNNKIYIGSSKNIHKRMVHHKSLLKNNKHFNVYLQYSYNKYGIENFVFFVIQACDKLDLLKMEDFYIKLNKSTNYENGYNLKLINKDMSGFVFSEASRQKNSNSHKEYYKKNRITHCKNGHEFNTENTIVNNIGRRKCKICYKEYNDKKNTKNKEITKQKKLIREQRTHCVNGHLICEENTYIYPSSGIKTCLICKRGISYKSYRKNNPVKPKTKKKLSSTCKYGHLLTEENLVYYVGKRYCLLCKKEYSKKRNAKIRENKRKLNNGN